MPKQATATTPAAEVYASLFDPFKVQGPTAVVERLHGFDAYMEKSRKQTYDAAEVRRARDWSVLAHQVVGHESFAPKRR